MTVFLRSQTNLLMKPVLWNGGLYRGIMKVLVLTVDIS